MLKADGPKPKKLHAVGISSNPVRWPSSRGRPHVRLLRACRREAEKVFGYAHTEHTRLHERAHALLRTADSHWSTVRLNVGRTGRQRAVRA